MATIEDLKLRVQEVFGLPITVGNQCRSLYHAILEQTGEVVSFNTLRRFFGHLETDSNPSIKTLNTLAKYCGYKHYHDFTEHYNTQLAAFDNYLLNIYKIDLRTPEDLNYHLACKSIAELLYQDLNLLDKHLVFFSTSKVAQVFLFEKFPFIDHLNNPIYRRALKEYAVAKNTADGYIYTESLLLLGTYLKNGKVGRLSPKFSDKHIDTLHPFLQARMLGTLLMAERKPPSVIISKAIELAKRQVNSLLLDNKFPFFNYMMADYFILCERYKDAMTLIEIAKYKRNTELGKMKEKGYYETFDLLYCACLLGTGRHDLALEAFALIDLSTFHFIFKSYFKIRYLNVKKALFGSIIKDEEEELALLKNKTQFITLSY